MAVKSLNFDMDYVKKHHFWFMLGGAVLLILVAFYWLATSAVGNIKTQWDAVNGDIDQIKLNNSNQKFFNAENIKLEQEALEKAKKAETDTWIAGFKEQEKLQSWPKAVEDRFHFQDGNFVTEIELIPFPPGPAPADEPHKIHGKIKEVAKDYLEIEPSNPLPKGMSPKFYYTADINRIGIFNAANPGPKTPLVLSDLAKEKGKPVRLSYYTSRRFYDKLTDEEAFEFKTHYRSQILPIIALVDPISKSGKGKVQLGADWQYVDDKTLPPAGAEFFTYVAADWGLGFDISKEAWIAQEDLWIQREIYSSIKEANDSLARFDPLPKKDAKSPNFRFSNFFYELDLTLNGSVLTAKVKNRLNRRQRFYLDLMIEFHKASKTGETVKPVSVHLEGLFLDPKGSENDSREATTNVTLDRPAQGIFKVTQVLTPTTVAVRSLDKVLIGFSDDLATAHSHRTFDKLVPYPVWERGGSDPGVPNPPAGNPPPSPDPNNPNAEPPPPMPEPMPIPGMVNPLPAKPVEKPRYVRTFDRYLKVTDAIRRVPVAVVMTVDQYQIDRVMTAFMNSKIRFLITQTLLQRDSKDTGIPPAAGVLEGKAEVQPAASDFDSSIELTIYGIYSLYERHPRVPDHVFPERR
jgi:hypothetical protein